MDKGIEIVARYHCPKEYFVLDRIAQEKIYYDKFAPLLIPMIVIAAVALVLVLAGLVILTLAAGRNNEDQEVHQIIDQLKSSVKKYEQL